MARKPVSQATRRVFAATVDSLGSLTPSDWHVEIGGRSDDGGTVRVDSPDGVSGELRVIVRRDITPRDVVAMSEPTEPTIIAAEWLSPRSRELLDDIGYGYVDLTGNVNVVMNRPGIVFRTDGAQRDPSPKPVPRLNIRGPRAWALLRTLAEVQPPYGVSDLAKAVHGDPGYVSRLLAALTDELMISRAVRGPVAHVEWEAVLRQIASSYSLLDSNETTSWVASGGAEQFINDLASSSAKQWAVTGSFAASRLVSVAAPEIAVVYTDDPERIATLTRLRRVQNGGNVVIAQPYDSIVFKRTWTRDNIVFASVAQTVVDSLTGKSTPSPPWLGDNLVTVFVDDRTGVPGRQDVNEDVLLFQKHLQAPDPVDHLAAFLEPTDASPVARFPQAGRDLQVIIEIGQVSAQPVLVFDGNPVAVAQLC